MFILGRMEAAMIKREIIRISIIAVIGFIVSLFIICEGNTTGYYAMLFMPIYFIGMLYAGKTLLKLLGMVAKTYFSCQFMSLLINPLCGTLICILLLCFGVAVIFSIGWLIGLGKCIYCLITAYQLDQQCRVGSNEFDFL